LNFEPSRLPFLAEVAIRKRILALKGIR